MPTECHVLIENPTYNETMLYAGSEETNTFMLQDGSPNLDTEINRFEFGLPQTGSIPVIGLTMEYDCHVIIRLPPHLRLTIILSVIEAVGYNCVEHSANAAIEASLAFTTIDNSMYVPCTVFLSFPCSVADPGGGTTGARPLLIVIDYYILYPVLYPNASKKGSSESL